MKRKNISGFTLIEMMIVICIIAILMALLLPNFIKAKFQSQLVGCMYNEKNLATACENYKTIGPTKLYPEELNVLLTEKYISGLPKCPTNKTDYAYERDSEGHNYTISCRGLHYLQLQNIDEGYPKYNAETGGVTYR